MKTGLVWLPFGEGHDRWDRALDQFPDAPYSLLYGWRRVYEKALGLKTHYLLAERQGRVSGLCPLVRMRRWGLGDGAFLISLPFQTRSGCWAADPETRAAMLAALGDLARDQQISTVELRELPGREAETFPVSHEHVEMVLDLPTDWQAYEKRIAPRLRQTRQARREGLTVRQGRDGDLLADFYQVFSRRMRELLFPVYPRLYFREILEAFPERSRLLLVYRDRLPLAGMLIVEHRETVSAPYVAALRGRPEEHPNQLLYFEAIRRAWESGFRFFSFCRSQPHSGTYRFKRQWQASPRPLAYAYPRLPSGGRVWTVQEARGSLTYRLAEMVWPRLPLAWTQWLGSRLIRRLVIA